MNMHGCSFMGCLRCFPLQSQLRNASWRRQFKNSQVCQKVYVMISHWVYGRYSLPKKLLALISKVKHVCYWWFCERESEIPEPAEYMQIWLLFGEYYNRCWVTSCLVQSPIGIDCRAEGSKAGGSRYSRCFNFDPGSLEWNWSIWTLSMKCEDSHRIVLKLGGLLRYVHSVKTL